MCVCVKQPLQKCTLPLLTIRERSKDGSRAEAAVTGGGVCPDLHLVLGGPAEVGQHGLVPAALDVVALVLAAPLLCHDMSR